MVFQKKWQGSSLREYLPVQQMVGVRTVVYPRVNTYLTLYTVTKMDHRPNHERWNKLYTQYPFEILGLAKISCNTKRLVRKNYTLIKLDLLKIQNFCTSKDRIKWKDSTARKYLQIPDKGLIFRFSKNPYHSVIRQPNQTMSRRWAQTFH